MHSHFAALVFASMELVASISASACPVIERLPLDWSPLTSPSQSLRIELWQCEGQSGSLTIALWANRAQTPALILDTSDFSVAQIFIKENTAVIETSGASRDHVFVFQYQEGSPRLVLRQVTKGHANIRSEGSHLVIKVTGIYSGDFPEREKTLELTTSLDALKAKT